MNESPSSAAPGAHPFRNYFFGASPFLRGLAAFSGVCLGAGWVVCALLACGVYRESFLPTIVATQMTAFTAGISSFCPCGGIIALLGVVTLFGGFIFCILCSPWALD